MAGVKVRDVAAAARALGVRHTYETARERLWSRPHLYLGLRCDLEALPEVSKARVPVEMLPCDPPDLAAFRDELGRVDGADYVQVLLRVWMADAGVRLLYLARTPQGAPIYGQWLVRREDQPRIAKVMPDAHDVLSDGEVLLEGAYTFREFRGCGAMADGMMQLLHHARADGHRFAITYVGSENIPSLRGCARVGFDLDHVRINTVRVGRRTSVRSEITPAAQAAWDVAIAPRQGVG
jgi:hypothetical protein